MPIALAGAAQATSRQDRLTLNEANNTAKRRAGEGHLKHVGNVGGKTSFLVFGLHADNLMLFIRAG